MSPLQQRILEISYKKKLSHIGSCLSVVDFIDSLYTKDKDVLFILSKGHAGLALYVVLEKHFGFDAEKLFDKHGVHPFECKEDKIEVTSGWLGQGITIALGRAIANLNRNVFCLISDGEVAEGAVFETLYFATRKNINNLITIIDCNGYSAYDKCDTQTLKNIFSDFNNVWYLESDDSQYPPFLKGLDAHYHVISDGEWKEYAKGN